jgi:amino acid adenylation domain-containing protein
MLEHFRVLLEAIAEHPEERISRLPLAAEAERQELLQAGRPAALAAPSGPEPACIHELFEAQAARTPGAEAVVAGETRLTYDQLNRRANQLARHLRGLGVGPEVPVGIFVADPIARLAAVLGVLKAGGAYLPLDTAMPRPRLARVLEEAGVDLIVTEEPLRGDLPEGGFRLVSLDANGPAIAAEGDDNLAPAATPANLAYVISTSGSLGQPKGVMVAHASLVGTYRSWEDAYALRSGPAPTRHLQMASFAFDVFTGDWVRALASGGTLVACPKETLLDPAALYELMVREQIDCAEFVPAVVENLIAYLEESGQRLDFLRLVVVGSDLWHAGEYERLRGLAGPATRVVNSYGLTEATIDSTFFEGDLAGRPANRPVPIGRPLGHARVYVLDRHREPCPRGVPGELYVGGPGLARGYHDRPRLTAEAFVPDPFGDDPGGRLYRTGDLARWSSDGTLELLGRIDHQVKLRGFRIELGEIEAALVQHPAVSEAAAAVVEPDGGDRRLVAYTVARPGAALPSAAGLRRFLQERLPRPMVPSVFVPLERLPLTPSGKVDRKALPVDGLEPLDPGTEGVPPRNPLEETLAAAWAQVLGLERVGVFDNFFDLGGHSLQAVQLVSRLASALGRPVPVRTVLQAPTIAEMAELLAHDEPAGDGVAVHGNGHVNGNGNGNGNGHGIEALLRQLGAPASNGLPEHLTIEERPLLTLLAAGRLAPVESVALGYFPSALRHQTGLDAETVTRGWCGDLPVITGIRETAQGRVGMVMIPRFDDQLYNDPDGLLEVLGDAVRLARTIGARTVSLTGLLPSATDYGRALARSLEGEDLPQITTGHATTTAAVVMAIRRALEEGGRALENEHVAFVGLGSVGSATLRLLLACLPHPAELSLCDLFSKQGELRTLQEELTGPLGYRGRVNLLESTRAVPEAIYRATLIVGATNMPGILDVDRAAPGTILVDDSAPHVFAADAALGRFRQRGDILATEGGVLASSEPLPYLVHVPAGLDPALRLGLLALLEQTQMRHITGCVLSGLLSSRFDHLAPTLGIVDGPTAFEHFRALEELGYRAAAPHLDEVPLDPREIAAFRSRYGREAATGTENGTGNGHGNGHGNGNGNGAGASPADAANRRVRTAVEDAAR